MILESLLLAAASLQVAQGEVVAIGQDRQLFVDRHLIESTDGCELRLGTPRDEGPVFEFDAPWEGRFCGYSTVIAHEGASSSITAASERRGPTARTSSGRASR